MAGALASSFSGAALSTGRRTPATAASRRPAMAALLSAPLRPYTSREGDTLSSIAAKRSLTVQSLQALNPQLKDALQAGQTILLPADSLSTRDKEILAGLKPGQNAPREYPVRAGETVETIAKNRNTTVAVIQKLNPGKKLSSLAPGTKLLLPSTCFSLREREWLQGTGIVPAEYFVQPAGAMFAAGSAGLVAVAAVVSVVFPNLFKKK